MQNIRSEYMLITISILFQVTKVNGEMSVNEEAKEFKVLKVNKQNITWFIIIITFEL